MEVNKSKIFKIKGKEYNKNPIIHDYQKNAIEFLKSKYESYNIDVYEILHKKGGSDHWLCIARHKNTDMKITVYKKTFFELYKAIFKNIDMIENF